MESDPNTDELPLLLLPPPPPLLYYYYYYKRYYCYLSLQNASLSLLSHFDSTRAPLQVRTDVPVWLLACFGVPFLGLGALAH